MAAKLILICGSAFSIAACGEPKKAGLASEEEMQALTTCSEWLAENEPRLSKRQYEGGFKVLPNHITIDVIWSIQEQSKLSEVLCATNVTGRDVVEVQVDGR